MNNKRIWELDFFRGFAIIMMVFDHLMYDLAHLDNYFYNFFSVDNPTFNWLNLLAENYWDWGLRTIGHFVFLTIFLTVSGISFTLSKSNLKRGLRLLIVALLITVVTYTIQEITSLKVFIVFGIIHLYGLSILMTYLFRKIWNNDIFILSIGFIVIIYGFSIEFWNLNYIYSISLSDIPSLLIGTKAFGADYFGLAPYLGIMMVGTVLGNIFYQTPVSILPNASLSKKNLFIFAGRNSLIIFLLHQIVLLVIMFIVGYGFGYRL